MSESGARGGSRTHDLTGQKFGRLTFVRLVRIDLKYNTYWICRCDCGNEKEILAASVKRGATKSCGCLDRESDKGGPARRSRNESLKYTTAHYRIQADRGTAERYRCVDCNGQAEEWSLRHDVAEVISGPVPGGGIRRWSANVLDYDPRCVPCHRAYDALTSRRPCP